MSLQLRSNQVESGSWLPEFGECPPCERLFREECCVVILAAAAGCQMTGTHPINVPGEDLTVDRLYPAKFNAVKIAVEDIMHNHEAMQRDRWLRLFPGSDNVFLELERARFTKWRTGTWKTSAGRSR